VSIRHLLLLGLAVGLYLGTHFASIQTSRLPWFDDTFFASVADAFNRTGEFKLTAAPLWLDKPVYLYGPVYFVVLGTVFDQFGIGVTQTRLPGLLFGFGIVLIAYAILRRVRVGRSLAILACAAMALDPTFHQNIHSGRMDSMAMFFILLSFYFLVRAGDGPRRSVIASTVASALFAALGVLTTPRPGYLLIPMALILLVRWARRRDLTMALSAIAWAAVILACIAAWVLYAFGSIPAMLEYYAHFSKDFTSGGFGVRALHAPLLVPLALLMLAALVVDRRSLLLYDIPFFTVMGIAEFYLFVKDKGTFGGLYSFFIIPLTYLALGYLLARLREATANGPVIRWIQYGIFALLFLFNGAIFAARTTLEAMQWEARSPAATDATVRALIPPGSKVVGDDKFYFAVRKGDSDFQYLQRGGTPEERARYHVHDYGLEYLITADGDTSDLVRAYLKEAPLIQIGMINAPRDGALARFITAVAQWAGIGSSLTANYEGRVFARATERPPAP